MFRKGLKEEPWIPPTLKGNRRRDDVMKGSPNDGHLRHGFESEDQLVLDTTYERKYAIFHE